MIYGTNKERVSTICNEFKKGRFRGSPYRVSLAKGVYQINPKANGKEIAALADFFRMFLQIDPDDRSTLTEILAHRWLAGVI